MDVCNGVIWVWVMIFVFTFSLPVTIRATVKSYFHYCIICGAAALIVAKNVATQWGKKKKVT